MLSYVIGVNFYIGSGLSFFSLFGIYLSYYFDIASGASVLLLSTLGFATVLTWSRLAQKRQIVAQRVKI